MFEGYKFAFFNYFLYLCVRYINYPSICVSHYSAINYPVS